MKDQRMYPGIVHGINQTIIPVVLLYNRILLRVRIKG